MTTRHTPSARHGVGSGLVLIVFALTLLACQRSASEVVVYTSHDQVKPAEAPASGRDFWAAVPSCPGR